MKYRIAVDRDVELALRRGAHKKGIALKDFAREMILIGLNKAPADNNRDRVYSTLTKREQEVLPFVLEGMPMKEIADELFIEPTTAKVHVRNIAKKAGLEKRGLASVRYFWKGR